jgi:hypothetical protein
MVSSDKPGNKKLFIVLALAGIMFTTGIVAFVVLTQPGAPGPVVPDAGRKEVQMSPTKSIDTARTGTRDEVTPPVTVTKVLPTISGSPAITLQPTRTGTPGTVTSGNSDSDTTTAPEPFSFSVSPVSASAKPGETLAYTLRIDGGQGQTEPIHFTLKASALFFTQTYEMGDEQPPFPKTVTYQFMVPGNIPPGITVNGIITATGAGQVREQPVTLIVK